MSIKEIATALGSRTTELLGIITLRFEIVGVYRLTMTDIGNICTMRIIFNDSEYSCIYRNYPYQYECLIMMKRLTDLALEIRRWLDKGVFVAIPSSERIEITQRISRLFSNDLKVLALIACNNKGDTLNEIPNKEMNKARVLEQDLLTVLSLFHALKYALN